MVDYHSSQTSSTCQSDVELFAHNIEGRDKRKGLIPQNSWSTFRYGYLNLRRVGLAFDIILLIACTTTLLCIAQVVCIVRWRGGFVRIPNDPYDIVFGSSVNKHSPAIWDDERQSFLYRVNPVPVHSHNDYLRQIPLFEALGSGCISVEADIHLHGHELLVGHSAWHLDDELTLRSLYLDPLERIITKRNYNFTGGTWHGIYPTALQQTLVLLIDQKTPGSEIFNRLHEQLKSLRDLDYLTYWDGMQRVIRPLTVVVSGNAQFEFVTALNSTRRDIFWDATLENLPSEQDNFEVIPVQYKYNQSNSYFASTQFKNARLWPNPVSNASNPQLRDVSASHMEQAKARGLLSRYWGTPKSPPNMREIVWRVLVQKEVDILNMDDLGTVRARANGWGRLEK